MNEPHVAHEPGNGNKNQLASDFLEHVKEK